MNRLLLIIFVVVSAQLSAQIKADYVWILGKDISPSIDDYGIVMDFSNDPVKPQLRNNIVRMNSNNASICDNDGNLLFYTNGRIVLNNDGQYLENGTGLNDDEWIDWFGPQDSTYGYKSVQDIMVIPDPGLEDEYYIIHKMKQFNGFNTEDSIPILTTKVKHDGSQGEVLYKNKHVYRDRISLTYYLTAISDANQRDWWIVQPLRDDSLFVTLRIDSSGVSFHSYQNSGHYFTGNRSSASGTAKFSPDGTRFALYNYYDQLHIYDFDRSTGVLSNHQQIHIFENPDFQDFRFSSVEWSPNSRFIYTATQQELHQIDTWEEDIQANGIRLIDTYNGTQDPFSTTFFLMAQAPDCRIYMCPTSSTNSYHVINYPNRLGKDCDFVQNGIALPETTGVASFPNFPRFRVDEAEKCDSTIFSIFGETVYYRRDLRVYPSPSTGLYKIELPETISKARLVVTDTQGNILRHEPIEAFSFSGEIALCDLPDGIYHIELYPEDHAEPVFYSRQVVKVGE